MLPRTTSPRGRRSLGPHLRLIAILNILLLVLVALTFVTGWLASLLGVADFAPHRLSSVALLVCVGLHVGLHRRALLNQWRHLRQGLQGGQPLGEPRITALPSRSSRERGRPPAA